MCLVLTRNYAGVMYGISEYCIGLMDKIVGIFHSVAFCGRTFFVIRIAKRFITGKFIHKSIYCVLL